MTKHNLLCACLAVPLLGLPGAARAAGPDCLAARAEPAPASVVLVAPAALEQQAAQLIAQANATFRQMAAEMTAIDAEMAALMQTPVPAAPALVPSVLAPVPFALGVPAQGTMISIASSGTGTCSETITYLYRGNGARPVVHVARSGNACGAPQGAAPREVMQPAPRRIAPEPVPPGNAPRLIEALYQPRG